MKKCTKCKLDLELIHFRKDPSKKDGKASYCKNCLKETQRIWYQNNKLKAQKTANSSYQKRKAKISDRRKELRKENPDKYKEAAKKRYNPNKSKEAGWRNAGIIDMTIEKYNELLSNQNNCCAVCNTHKDAFKRALSVDHNHTTGKFRGLLCDNCNRALGYLKESEVIINNLLTYLQCHR